MNTVLYGEVVRGGRYASGLHEPERPNETGTIALQRPFLLSAGVERAGELYVGTINISIAPKEIEIMEPDYMVASEWLPGVFETFWLVEITLVFRGKRYPAYLYYPCPSELKAHPDSTIEVLTEKIEGLAYGEAACLQIPQGKVALR
jgi:hypothetical protein